MIPVHGDMYPFVLRRFRCFDVLDRMLIKLFSIDGKLKHGTQLTELLGNGVWGIAFVTACLPELFPMTLSYSLEVDD